MAIFRRKADYSNKPDFGFDWYAGNKYGTTYNEPYDFEDNKTVLSGRNKLQKEYTSFIKYIPIRELGYMEAGKNSGGSIINLNGKIYFVPWFSAFAKDDSGNSKSYELDVFLILRSRWKEISKSAVKVMKLKLLLLIVEILF